MEIERCTQNLLLISSISGLCSVWRQNSLEAHWWGQFSIRHLTGHLKLSEHGLMPLMGQRPLLLQIVHSRGNFREAIQCQYNYLIKRYPERNFKCPARQLIYLFECIYIYIIINYLFSTCVFSLDQLVDLSSRFGHWPSLELLDVYRVLRGQTSQTKALTSSTGNSDTSFQVNIQSI